MVKLIIEVPLEFLPLIKINEDKPFLVSNKNGKNGKCWRVTNLKIPKKSGIYFLYSKDKELLYIGETNNLIGRLSMHRRETPGAFYVKTFSTKMTKRKRMAVEQLLIDKLNPKLQGEVSPYGK